MFVTLRFVTLFFFFFFVSFRLGPLFNYLMRATLFMAVTSYHYTQGTPLRYSLLVKSNSDVTRLVRRHAA